jgi:hypothetical protein
MRSVSLFPEWGQKSPRLLAGFWFAGLRFMWGPFWFSEPSSPVLVFRFASGFLPLLLAVVSAGLVGSLLGSSILDPGRTRSYWMAGLKGILVEHLTTALYVPVGDFVASISAGELQRFVSGLLMDTSRSSSGRSITSSLLKLKSLPLMAVTSTSDWARRVFFTTTRKFSRRW